MQAKRAVMQPVYLNGRFLTQSLTGVQRFAFEVTAAIDRLAASGRWPEIMLLTPRQDKKDPGDRRVSYRCLQQREIGRTQGHLWEQTELAAAARRGILVSLGNTGPMALGKRQIVVIHDAGVFDTPESYSFQFRTWYRTLQHGLALAGAHIVTVSLFSRDRIVACLGLNPSQVSVMYEGADHILRVAADHTVLTRHQLIPGRFALVVGSRVEHKNLTVLARAAGELQRQGIMIAIAGGGDPNVFRTTEGAGSSVRQLGRVTDAELRALYESALCLLFPSRYEGFGLPPVEAMACGCPVVASRGGAVEEICGDSILYFDTHQKDTIISAVGRLADEAGLVDDLRERGLARAAALSWEASAQVLCDVIHDVRS
jgi:glycosyltransferase involved in cell wall biosynthesis